MVEPIVLWHSQAQGLVHFKWNTKYDIKSHLFHGIERSDLMKSVSTRISPRKSSICKCEMRTRQNKNKRAKNINSNGTEWSLWCVSGIWLAFKIIISHKHDFTSVKDDRYGVIQKKLFKGHFRIMWTAWSKKNFCNGILGQRTIFVQIFKIFGCHQNHGY